MIAVFGIGLTLLGTFFLSVQDGPEDDWMALTGFWLLSIGVTCIVLEMLP